MNTTLISLNDASSFDWTLTNYFGADLANIITSVLTWIMVAFAVIAVIGAVIATIFHRMSAVFSLDGDTEKYEKAKKISKHIWISVGVIFLLCIVGPGAIWIVLSNMSGDKLAQSNTLILLMNR